MILCRHARSIECRKISVQFQRINLFLLFEPVSADAFADVSAQVNYPVVFAQGIDDFRAVLAERFGKNRIFKSTFDVNDDRFLIFLHN